MGLEILLYRKILHISAIFCLNFAHSFHAFAEIQDAVQQRDYYFAAKRSFERLLYEHEKVWRGGGRRLHVDGPLPRLGLERPSIDIFNCGGSWQYGTDQYSDNVIQSLSDLAHGLSSIKFTLRLHSIPDDAWRSEMIDFEDAVLRQLLAGEQIDPWILVNEFSKGLAPIINLRTTAPLPAVRAEGECGAGEIRVRVSTNPASGRLFMVPLLFWYVCDELGIPNEDSQKCHYWKEIPNGTEKVEVAGDYRYRAVWQDGRSLSGLMQFRHDTGDDIVVTPVGLRSKK
ncbi:MAG: hypothetical protein AAGE99_05845 [Chlamydiota bacterium]